jgi:anti-sigma-K factor RskA
MTHEEMKELYELYLLGVLEPEAAGEIERHFREGCPECIAGLRQASVISAGLSALSEPIEPSPRLRGRVTAMVAGAHYGARRPWVAYAGVAASLALLCWSLVTLSQLRSERSRLASIAFERDRLQSVIQFLTEQRTLVTRSSTAQTGPNVRVFVAPQQGFVFVGSGLPPIQSDRTFQLWLVPPSGAPQPAGLFRGQDSNAVYVSHTNVDLARTAAIAVSVEPQGGSPAPTTKPFVLVPLS